MFHKRHARAAEIIRLPRLTCRPVGSSSKSCEATCLGYVTLIQFCHPARPITKYQFCRRHPRLQFLLFKEAYHLPQPQSPGGGRGNMRSIRNCAVSSPRSRAPRFSDTLARLSWRLHCPGVKIISQFKFTDGMCRGEVWITNSSSRGVLAASNVRPSSLQYTPHASNNTVTQTLHFTPSVRIVAPLAPIGGNISYPHWLASGSLRSFSISPIPSLHDLCNAPVEHGCSTCRLSFNCS